MALVTILFDQREHTRDVEVPASVKERSRKGSLQVLPGRSVVLTDEEVAALDVAKPPVKYERLHVERPKVDRGPPPKLVQARKSDGDDATKAAEEEAAKKAAEEALLKAEAEAKAKAEVDAKKALKGGKGAASPAG